MTRPSPTAPKLSGSAQNLRLAYWDRGMAYTSKGEKAKAEKDFLRAKKLGYEAK